MKKIVNFLRTKTAHLIIETGVVLSMIPILYSNDIGVVKGFSAISLILFLIYMVFPINGYEILLSKFKKYLKSIIKNNPNISFIEKELNRLESENL